jgi:GNAT superfamily N-acetyltransferase
MIGVYTVRKDEKLVGYLVVLARNHPHYKDHIFASNDILFIDKEHRKGLVGYFLVKYVTEDLEKRGVSVLLFNTTVDKPYDPILKRLGFKHSEKLYTKYLGE